MRPERKLYQDLKKNTSQIIWNRIENLSLIGMPDVLGYNNSGHFFTVELKVAKGYSVQFSPHHIAFHLTHPKHTYILIRVASESTLKLFPGSEIRGLSTEGHLCGWPLADSWEEIQKIFNQLA